MIIQTGVSYVPASEQHRDDPYGEYDPKLGRYRRPSDDFFDHRKLVLERITQSLALEEEKSKYPRRFR